MAKIDIVGLGALNMDYLHQVESILSDGEAVVKKSIVSPGGSAANTIYGLAKLGVKTGFAGVVGKDDDGKALIQDFKKVGVDTSRVVVKSRAKTGLVIGLSDICGKRSLYVSPGANNLMTIDDLDIDYLNQAKMLHITSFAGAKQFKMSLELMGKLDLSVKVSFSPGALYAGKGPKTLASILSRTYVLFINGDEIKELTGQDVVGGAETCLGYGCQMVVVTLGKGTKIKLPNGCGAVSIVAYIKDSENFYIEEPLISKTAPVDTTGAGDAFAAGFLYGLLNGKDPEECGHLGNVVAQFSITKVGARQGLPTLKQLLACV